MNINIDDSDNNVKVSDSAYSNSCSNSQSRRSLKSTLSGSNSSGSSGYGGKKTITGTASKFAILPEDKEGDSTQGESSNDGASSKPEAIRPSPSVRKENEDKQSVTKNADIDMGVPTHNIQWNDHFTDVKNNDNTSQTELTSSIPTYLSKDLSSDGFSFVISMVDGVVKYTTPSITQVLGFEHDMWLGRSFIDFLHAQDRDTFGTEIRSRHRAVLKCNPSAHTMLCRIRVYKDLILGFEARSASKTYMPFTLELSFQDMSRKEDIVFVIIKASPFVSAYTVPNQKFISPTEFYTRYLPCGKFDYIDAEAVPYLGFLPQDMMEKNAVNLCHVDDLPKLLQVYKSLAADHCLPQTKAYRIMIYNGDFLVIQTEFSCFMDPWSRKLQYIFAKHIVIEGPTNPNVFEEPDVKKSYKLTAKQMNGLQYFRQKILKTISKISSKPEEVSEIIKRSQDMSSVKGNLTEDGSEMTDEANDDQNLDVGYPFYTSMIDGVPFENQSKACSEVTLTYLQLSYEENLQRYFNRYQPCSEEEFDKEFGPHSIREPPMETAIYEPQYTQKEPMLNLSRYVLTVNLLNNHDKLMKREFIIKKSHERPVMTLQQKKDYKKNRKEHIARCNAPFKSTQVEVQSEEEIQCKRQKTEGPAPNIAVDNKKDSTLSIQHNRKAQGLKRASRQSDLDVTSHKHHCHQQPICDAPQQPSSDAPQQLSCVAPPQLSNVAPPQLSSNAPPQLSSNAPPQLSSNAPPQLSSDAPQKLSSNPPLKLICNAPEQLSYNVSQQLRYNISQQPNYNVPQQPRYKAPKQPTYKAPKQQTYNVRQQPSYNFSLRPSYNGPQQPRYNIPQQPSYNVPQQPSYNVPLQLSFNIPPQPRYNLPPLLGFNVAPQPSYNVPQQPNYNLPPPLGFNVPPQPRYNAPPPLGFNIPPLPSYNVPPQPSYNVPPQSSYNVPPQPSYNNPPQPSYNVPPPLGFNVPSQPRYNVTREDLIRPEAYFGKMRSHCPPVSSAAPDLMYPMIYNPIGSTSRPAYPNYLAQPSNYQHRSETLFGLPSLYSSVSAAPPPSESLQDRRPSHAFSGRKPPRTFVQATTISETDSANLPSDGETEAASGIRSGDLTSLSFSLEKYGTNPEKGNKEPGEYSKHYLSCDRTSDLLDGNYRYSKKSKTCQALPRLTEKPDDHSSFCSASYKTDSGMSVEDEDEDMNAQSAPKQEDQVSSQPGPSSSSYSANQNSAATPPLETQLNVTSEVPYQYQMSTKQIDDVLKEDSDRMHNIMQSNLVNEQLSQLYIDLHLEGAPMELTLNAGAMSSSCSSGDENKSNKPQSKETSKIVRSKRYSTRLGLIYEEDAPLPHPE